VKYATFAWARRSSLRARAVDHARANTALDISRIHVANSAEASNQPAWRIKAFAKSR
jgi:hypothetical protein